MSGDTVRDAVTRETVLKALLDEVKAAYEEARADVQHALDEQKKATGSTKFEATLPDGTKVGSVSLTGGEPTAQVTDREAFVAWARTAYPSEATTVIVKDVRASFTADLLAKMTAAGVTADPDTGEEVPGVEIRPTRARSHSVNFTRKSKNNPRSGRELVGEAWRTGTLAVFALPALAAAEQAEHPPPEEPPAAPDRPARRVGRRFTAAFPGECAECFGRFDGGDEVAYVDDELCCEHCADKAES